MSINYTAKFGISFLKCECCPIEFCHQNTKERIFTIKNLSVRFHHPFSKVLTLKE